MWAPLEPLTRLSQICPLSRRLSLLPFKQLIVDGLGEGTVGGSCVPLFSVQPPFEVSCCPGFFGLGEWSSPPLPPIPSVGLLGNSGPSLDYGKFNVWGGDLGLLWPRDSRGAQASRRLGVLKLRSCPPPTPLQTPNREVLVVKESVEKSTCQCSQMSTRLWPPGHTRPRT